jgi:hypothetical protein
MICNIPTLFNRRKLNRDNYWRLNEKEVNKYEEIIIGHKYIR